MTYQEVMEYIEGLKVYGSVPGLENIENLCDKLGNPQKELSFVHIAGTNGKGSVLAFLSEVLKAAGYRTGRYVSPTLFEYRERIAVNNRPISKKELCTQMTVLKEICWELVEEGKPHPTAFEIETAMAFQYFKEKECQIVVLETGLGGRLDATNIVTNTLAAVFTSISMDHMGVLGKSLQEIAENKAGIMKPGAAAVALKGEPEVNDVLEKKASLLGIPLITADFSDASGIKRSLAKQTFSYKEYKNLTISLVGAYQIENALLAAETIRTLKEKGYKIPDKAVYKGFEHTSWQGRFQILAKRPYFIADGAHNRDGAKRLAETIRLYFTNRKIIYIMGMLRDKEQDEILKATCPLASQILTVPTRGERGLSAYDLACKAKEYHDYVTALDSVEEAVEMAYLLADKDAVIIAFGSLSYLGGLIQMVEKINAQKGRNDIGRDSHGKQRES
ncbi:MAG: bifunctional folylpolyglutamate synthase/dihydrofolate synthase [Lachnospiraceae bacterium]|nr:bifunctional folylpolyglutamate synthase/dihydrofolate synthase [Lachnospiraceae bacterium]